jgi:SagB-type dehydrogenase family enzyme
VNQVKTRSARARCRRARATLAYWKGGELVLENYATRVSITADPIAIRILDFFERWRNPESISRAFPEYSAASLARGIRQLIAHTMLVREGTREAAADADLDRVWSDWLPEGGFHFATKNAPYIDLRLGLEERRKTLPARPQPPFFKSYPGARAIALPRVRRRDSEFEDVLLARKTHRSFAKGGVSLEQVATLLSLVWGVQGRINSPLFGKLAHKTSPSGGARHPGEVYLMAKNVAGLRQGIYHYHPVHHRLTPIKRGSMRGKAWRYCVRQQHAEKASALFLMTAMFPRTMWKYHTARAYRVVLLDAGHLCQTFCLAATWMGLAPFSTAALDDTLIERDLGIDGIRESILYVSGIGVPLATTTTPSALRADVRRRPSSKGRRRRSTST